MTHEEIDCPKGSAAAGRRPGRARTRSAGGPADDGQLPFRLQCVLLRCDHSHRQSGKPAVVFLAEVLRGDARFLAFLCASGTCARRAGRRTMSGAAVGGAAAITAKARSRNAANASSGHGSPTGMAERKDCLVATPDRGPKQSAETGPDPAFWHCLSG